MDTVIRNELQRHWMKQGRLAALREVREMVMGRAKHTEAWRNAHSESERFDLVLREVHYIIVLIDALIAKEVRP